MRKLITPALLKAALLVVLLIGVISFGVIYSGKQPSEADTEGDTSVVQVIEVPVVPSEEITSSEVADVEIAAPDEETIPGPIVADETAASSAPLVTTELLLISLIALSFVALVVSLWVNVFLLKWRRAVTAKDDEQNWFMSIVPSELLERVDKQTTAFKRLVKNQEKAFEELLRALSTSSGRVIQEAGETRSASGEVLKAFTGLQKALNQKDAEIERLRGGYDNEVFRRFLSRFLKLEKIIGEDIEELASDDSKTCETLTEIQTLLKDALAECGLESFSPELGASIRDLDGVENSKQLPAEHAEQVFTIAEVIEPGWCIRTPGGFDYVKYARVVVYVEAPPVEEVA